MFFKKIKQIKSKLTKREQIRALVQLPATFTRHGSAVVQRGIIIDISRGGVLMLKLPKSKSSDYARPLKLLDIVHLKFHLPIVSHELIVEGIVKHIDKKDQDFPSVDCVGIEFADIPNIDVAAIGDFIKAGMSALKDSAIRNKRKFARLPLDIPVIFSDERGENFFKTEGKIINLSAAGVMLVREKKFFSSRLVAKISKDAIGPLNIRFKFSSKGRVIKALCRICRITPGFDEFEEYWCLGLQFLTLDIEDQKVILKFVALERERLMTI